MKSVQNFRWVVARTSSRRPTVTVATVAVAVLTLFPFGETTAQVAETRNACLEWSVPVDLWLSSSQLERLEPWDLALLPGSAPQFAITSFRARPGEQAGQLLISDLHGTVIPPPPGGKVYFGPAGAVDEVGTLHLIWFEPAADAGREIFGYRRDIVDALQRVLYARYREGHWSKPEEIYAATKLRSLHNGRTSLIVDDSGTLHFILTGPDPYSLVYLRRLPQGWITTHIDRFEAADITAGGGGIYPTIAHGDAGRVFLGIISGARRRDAPGTMNVNANSVFFRRSSDGGGSWGEQMLVHLSDGSPAMELRLVRTAADSLHMLWASSSRVGSLDLSGAAHSVSVDSGRSWSDARYLPFLDQTGSIQLMQAVSIDGHLNLFFTASLDRAQPLLWRMRYRKGSWASPELVSRDTTRRVSNFHVSSDASGRLHLLWAHTERWREPENGLRDARLSYAVLSSCRESRD